MLIVHVLIVHIFLHIIFNANKFVLRAGGKLSSHLERKITTDDVTSGSVAHLADQYFNTLHNITPLFLGRSKGIAPYVII